MSLLHTVRHCIQAGSRLTFRNRFPTIPPFTKYRWNVYNSIFEDVTDEISTIKEAHVSMPVTSAATEVNLLPRSHWNKFDIIQTVTLEFNHPGKYLVDVASRTHLSRYRVDVVDSASTRVEREREELIDSISR